MIRQTHRRVPTFVLSVVWFKRDLRIADHRALAAAAARGPVLPLYIAEPELWQQPDASARQWDTLAEALVELRAALARLGQPLVVRVGSVVPLLTRLHARHGIASLHSHEETGTLWTYARDRAVARWCRDAGVPWLEERQTGVIRRLRDRDGWASRWRSFMAEPLTPPPSALPPIPQIEPGAIPTAQELGLAPDPCPGRQPGGRAAALACLTGFLTTRGRDYRRAMASPVTAATGCSRLSTHLAVGTLSLREVVVALAQRRANLGDEEAARGWRGALSSFEGRLAWHCHFMQKLEDEPTLEHRALHPAYRSLDRVADAGRLAAFQAGRTGWPFVDAALRSLAATGWLNFRARAMLMAVASYHLWLPWRDSGLILARWFSDYEPGIHWPQAQMQSGVTGINTIRIYNPVKQGLDQDPDGRFVRRWLPELAPVPDALVHEPWRWSEAHRLAYPPPLVDHLEAARTARDCIWAIRRAAGFAEDADAIQHRHGSRRSGLPPTTRTPQPRRSSTSAAQLSLGLEEP
ncbi:MAG: deoxyribodipyrimidine photo-lyase/cryptochrome family protein [Alphaproteobacteria bacterium]|nr:MAG: deoxyribodipyrimidine photo-lyase/cryptochrome family protein [Alphaproteobacteria bacterium]